eukprot:TRINITY_DN62699_c0_g1_i1.p1 TRINITY_DN62699_c0_g1~~TRINITY_DN62699_c0_g1_i1.p1  ORF type:complete len:646 (+),score=177.54 TRINITY_DN62699_c0_g1_i1:110-2047(+)
MQRVVAAAARRELRSAARLPLEAAEPWRSRRCLSAACSRRLQARFTARPRLLVATRSAATAGSLAPGPGGRASGRGSGSGARVGARLQPEASEEDEAYANEELSSRLAGATDILGEDDNDSDDVAGFGGAASDDESASEGEESGGRGGKAGPFAVEMWKSAVRGVRAEWVWSKYSQRVLATTSLMSRGDTVLTIMAYARIKYRDAKVLEAMSPFMLNYIDEFTTRDLVLLLNAHKKLEWQRLDNVRLLMNALLPLQSEWTGQTVALAVNALAHFYVYEPRFWKAVAVSISSVVWSMNPLQLSCLVSALARVDRRDPRCLLMIARMCRRCAKSHLFSQETLATTMNAFAKLDFNHPRLAQALEDAALVKIDRALALGPGYRRSNLRGDEDIFDVQALVRVLHTLVCLVGCSHETARKLLTLVAWSKDDISDYQRRALRTVGKVVRAQYKELYTDLRPEVKRALSEFEKTPGKLVSYESRWGRELRQTLQRMNVEVEAKSLIDEQVVDILLPSSNAVVCAVGPYSYYTNTTHRTAYSKLHQRLLEFAGYQCMVVPYYEWAELRVDEDKMVYLWSLGRRTAAAAAEAAMTGAEPAEVEDDGFTTQTDLEDMEEPEQQQSTTRFKPNPRRWKLRRPEVAEAEATVASSG